MNIPKKRRVRGPLIVLLVAGAIAAALSGCQKLSRNRVAAEIAAESATHGISPIENLGSTDCLEILPRVEQEAAGPQYLAEHGVSAVIGTLPFAEVMDDPGLPDRNFEQALAVNVAGRGVILVVGCGHPGVPKLVERARAALGRPIAGVIGGLAPGFDSGIRRHDLLAWRKTHD